MERQQEMPEVTESSIDRSKAKVTFFVVFTSALLIIVYKLLDSFIEKVFTTNKDELYGYVMQAGILACTVSVIKFNTLFLIGKKLQIIDIDETKDESTCNPVENSPRNSPSTSRSKRIRKPSNDSSHESDDDTQGPGSSRQGATATSSTVSCASVSSDEKEPENKKQKRKYGK